MGRSRRNLGFRSPKQYHADINAPGTLSILHLAAKGGSVEMIKFIVTELGRNPNAVDMYGCEEWAHRCVQSSRIRIWCRHECQE
ncbi:hypothetical protein BC937DRAFT_91488 [Endogone sp. FLAS-F59071]|nr:hypothetical protein BC937DRAFT_91488 [Endogone sp. FLAS-F59071]|eukprot:RUS21774.1 hypothetical protein BC937DRAFT_91488 [Endogone sp. FLAS-F59071]